MPNSEGVNASVFAALLLAIFVLLVVPAAVAESEQPPAPVPLAPSERNVVFGMYGGLALLLDVYRPPAGVTPNGLGMVCIPGSGWHRPLGYNAPPLKDDAGQVALLAGPLVRAGYTVFVINHRAAPTFRYPAAWEDAQRAVRWVRHNAAHYQISAERIGGVGASSGGHLVCLLGTHGGKGDASDPDPVNRESARTMAVVAYFPPTDLTQPFHGDYPSNVLGSFLGMTFDPYNQNSLEYKAYRDASPVTYVSGSSAPTLLIHGDKDDVVPFAQSEILQRALTAAKVPVQLIRVPGAGHGFEPKPEYPDFTGAMVRWLDQHLERGGSGRR